MPKKWELGDGNIIKCQCQWQSMALDPSLNLFDTHATYVRCTSGVLNISNGTSEFIELMNPFQPVNIVASVSLGGRTP